LGVGNGGLAGEAVPYQPTPVEGTVDMRVVLDTTGGAGAWTATWFAKRAGSATFTEVRPETPLLDETTITAVGIAVSNPGIVGTFEAFSLSTLLGPQPPVLRIFERSGLLDFEWNSRASRQYDLVSIEDPELQPDPALWEIYEIGETRYENIKGSDTGMNLLEGVPFSGPVRFFALIEEPIPPLLSQNFDLDDGGFMVIDNSAGGVGTDWAWDIPQSDPGFGGGAVTEDNGGAVDGKCWGTDVGNPGVYVDGTDTSLISPVVDLTDVESAFLSFAQAVDILSPDSLTVNIIDDDISGGVSVIAGGIYTEDDEETTGSADWENVTGIDLADGLGQPVRLEFRFVGDGDGSFMGAYLDDIVITGQ
jgi:hypothetical protein